MILHRHSADGVRIMGVGMMQPQRTNRKESRIGVMIAENTWAL